MKYAIIENGVVVNTVVSNSALKANWVQSDTAGIGWTYDGSTFTAPTPVAEPVQPWTRKEFLLKFTPAEYAAIKAATLADATLDYYWSLFTVAQEVVKTDPVTIAGINALEAAGHLAVGRAAEILA